MYSLNSNRYSDVFPQTLTGTTILLQDSLANMLSYPGFELYLLCNVSMVIHNSVGNDRPLVLPSFRSIWSQDTQRTPAAGSSFCPPTLGAYRDPVIRLTVMSVPHAGSSFCPPACLLQGILSPSQLLASSSPSEQR